MDPTVTLTVAIIAAVASLAGALVAWASARAARLSADGIDRRRHMIESLDAEAQSFRDALDAVYQALYEMDLGTDAHVVIRVMVRVQSLRTHPLCTPKLGTIAARGVAGLHKIKTRAQKGEPQDSDDQDAPWADFRDEARQVLQVQATKRRELIEDIQMRRIELSRSVWKPASDKGKSKDAHSLED